MKAQQWMTATVALMLALAMAACQRGAEGDSSARGATARSDNAVVILDPPDAKGASSEKAMIAAPKRGDIYAAEIGSFSEMPFDDVDKGKRGTERLYGLMKVVQTSTDGVVVITEAAASTQKEVSLDDIQGDLVDITFDPDERIELSLPDLGKAYAEGRIYKVRRN